MIRTILLHAGRAILNRRTAKTSGEDYARGGGRSGLMVSDGGLRKVAVATVCFAGKLPGVAAVSVARAATAHGARD